MSIVNIFTDQHRFLSNSDYAMMVIINIVKRHLKQQ